MNKDIPEKKRAIDNLTYKEDKEKMQKGNGIMVADVSDKMTVPQVKEFIRRYKTGESTKDYLKQFNLKKIELDELQKLADRNKRTS